MKIELVCNGELINKHSDGGRRHREWSNPIDVIPPIGSVIEYLTFNQNHLEGQGVLTKFRVIGHRFTMEEDFNNTYRNQVCQVEMDVINDDVSE